VATRFWVVSMSLLMVRKVESAAMAAELVMILVIVKIHLS
jgi:hypothetical protein